MPTKSVPMKRVALLTPLVIMTKDTESAMLATKDTPPAERPSTGRMRNTRQKEITRWHLHLKLLCRSTRTPPAMENMRPCAVFKAAQWKTTVF